MMREVGCHKLIYDGAGIAYSPEILLDEWGLCMKKMTNLWEKMIRTCNGFGFGV